MANNAIKQEPENARDVRAAAEIAVHLEDCRSRLQSIELLVASSRRDALILARMLLDDLIEVLNGSLAPSDRSGVRDANQVVHELPEGATRAQLLAARSALAAGPPDAVSDEAIIALRALVASVARTTAAQSGWRAFASGISPGWRRGLVAGLVLLLVAGGAGAFHLNASRADRAAKFQKSFAAAEQQLRAGEHANAIATFRSAIAAAPDDSRAADAWNDMAWSLQQLGRHREAIAGYKRALALKPGFSLAQNNLKALNPLSQQPKLK